MDLGTRVVLSVALLLALNTAAVRLPVLQDRVGVLLAVQALNVLAGSVLLWKGVPGFEQIPAISWMLGLLLFLHVAQNTRWYAERRRERSRAGDVDQRASAIRAALDRADPVSTASPPPEGPPPG